MTRPIPTLAAWFGLLLLPLFLAMGDAASAQSDAVAEPTPPPPMRGRLHLHVGEGRLLQLDQDARNVFMGDASVADVQVVDPRDLYVYGRKPGETTLTAVAGSTGLAAQLTLEIDRSSAAATHALPVGSHVELRFEGNRLTLAGPVRDLGEAVETNATAEAFNPGRAPPLDETQLPGAQQVTLRVRIAEVSRSVENQLGINFNLAANPGSLTVGLVTGSFLGSAASSALAGGTQVNNFTSFGNASIGVHTSKVTGEVLLNALQGEGLLSTLAEPNLTTISGETAHFLAGGEVPIPVPQALGVTTITYKQYGVSLDFTPTLLPNQRIAMRVHPTVSEISAANAVTIASTAVPSFVERETDTQVEMASGQTLAIAGLYQRNDNTSVSKFPFLGDLPILGALFRSTSFQRNETELVILVTPYVSRPVSSPDVTLPNDPLRQPAPVGQVSAGFVAN